MLRHCIQLYNFLFPRLTFCLNPPQILIMIPSLLLPLYLPLLPSTAAWVFSWTDPSGQLLTDHGSQTQACRQIDNPEGNVFDWDAEGGSLCLYLYDNTDCSDPSAGYTCKPWPWDNHESGSHILSYEIVQNGTSGTSSSTVASSTATLSTTGTVATATSTSTSSSASGSTENGSSLSGGAIAGVVVGVLAAGALSGILFFFFLWRRRSAAPTAAVQPGTRMSELQAGEKPYQEPASSSLFSQQPVVVRELPGSHAASEMGGVERAELDGSPMYGKF